MSARRVVVTGLGIVSPVGVGVKHAWSNLIAGKSGGIVPRSGNGSFNPKEWLEPGDTKRMADFSQYAMCAANQALTDAEWTAPTDAQRERTGVCIGTGIGSMDDITSNYTLYQAGGLRKISPMFVPKVLCNMAAGNISIRYGFYGPNHAVSTACTTGAHAIGDAMRFIKFGDADVMVAGASEAPLQPLSLAWVLQDQGPGNRVSTIALRRHRGHSTKERAGFVIGEGAGALVLEELEHAKRRGAHIYAEIRGYGLSGDGFHITAPPNDGAGAQHITYVNAHATSTPLGDEIENRAIKSVFADTQLQQGLMVSSTKSATGHLAGNIDADAGFDLNYVANQAQERTIKAALTNSFGFGGTNASLIFTKYE
ncbi:thiolase-like protein [Linderina pennispora]|uniref:beta-ketoacyl-[acyl-carrier-protein] synthase I n=1 Tax=Linderina pennispora TaxID=61395 RepID=A0A1Y1W338_9FUNG|nr:thiolase-like protein [Linderina pennispora]ORX67802.1 thiolase-like protein [Linderina pennispora]